jgi:hypothetical protein
MSANYWDANADGSLMLLPLTVGRGVPQIDGSVGGVRIDFAVDRIIQNLASNQLVFAAPQLRRLY